MGVSGADGANVWDAMVLTFSGRLGISAGSDECKYSAAIQRGSMAYFVPSSAENIGTLHVPHAPHLLGGIRCQASWTWSRGASEPFPFRLARANGNTVEEQLDGIT